MPSAYRYRRPGHGNRSPLWHSRHLQRCSRPRRRRSYKGALKTEVALLRPYRSVSIKQGDLLVSFTTRFKKRHRNIFNAVISESFNESGELITFEKAIKNALQRQDLPEEDKRLLKDWYDVTKLHTNIGQIVNSQHRSTDAYIENLIEEFRDFMSRGDRLDSSQTT